MVKICIYIYTYIIEFMLLHPCKSHIYIYMPYSLIMFQPDHVPWIYPLFHHRFTRDSQWMKTPPLRRRSCRNPSRSSCVARRKPVIPRPGTGNGKFMPAFYGDDWGWFMKSVYHVLVTLHDFVTVHDHDQ